jgi:hypothetical protein
VVSERVLLLQQKQQLQLPAEVGMYLLRQMWVLFAVLFSFPFLPSPLVHAPV